MTGTQQLVIIGAGGFGREALDVIGAINYAKGIQFETVGFLDDGQPDLRTLDTYGSRHLGPIEFLDKLPPEVGYVIGIGSPQIRRKIAEQYPDRHTPTLIHPAATVGPGVEIGEGGVICAGARLTNNIRLGRHVHLNLNSTVGHDARLGDFVTVSPQVAISGYAVVEDEVMLGTGAILNPGVRVGAGAVLGSGAVAVRDIGAGVTAVGVPARAR